MTTALREALTDLADGVAPYVVREDLGRTAWSRGRRRRWRRRAVRSALALLAIAFVVTNVFPIAVVPSFGGDPSSPVVDGYPGGIGHQWRIPALPDRPGPIAGLMLTDGWYAVSPTGVRWSLSTAAGDQPTVSPDGRYVALLEAADGPYAIRDLVTGTRKVFPAVGLGAGSAYQLPSDSPKFWAPDGRHLAMRATQPARGLTGVLVLGVDGSEFFGSDEFTAGADRLLVGWAGPSALVWLRVASAHAATVETDWLYGPTFGVVVLVPTQPWSLNNVTMWHMLVSPDGSSLVVLEPVGSETTVHRFSLTTGNELEPPAVTPRAVTRCAPTWVGSEVAIPVSLGANVDTALVTEQGIRPLVVIEAVIGSRCLVWATGALAGTRHGSPWDDSTYFWWRELLVVCVLATSLGYVVWRFLRRRRFT